MATVLNYSSKRGADIVKRGEKWEGNWLNQVYDSWSARKQQAFDWCYEKYLATPDHDAWGICSHNTNTFSVSWVGTYNGENALFMETKSNSYVVLLDK